MDPQGHDFIRSLSLPDRRNGASTRPHTPYEPERAEKTRTWKAAPARRNRKQRCLSCWSSSRGKRSALLQPPHPLAVDPLGATKKGYNLDSPRSTASKPAGMNYLGKRCLVVGEITQPCDFLPKPRRTTLPELINRSESRAASAGHRRSLDNLVQVAGIGMDVFPCTPGNTHCPSPRLGLTPSAWRVVCIGLGEDLYRYCCKLHALIPCPSFRLSS